MYIINNQVHVHVHINNQMHAYINNQVHVYH